MGGENLKTSTENQKTEVGASANLEAIHSSLYGPQQAKQYPKEAPMYQKPYMAMKKHFTHLILLLYGSIFSI